MRREALTRREALQAGAGAVAVATLGRPDAAGAATAGAVSTARERSFDEGWLFFRGDASGADAAGFDDSGWRELDVPHDWRIEDLPTAASDDGSATANPSAMAFVTRPSPDGNPPTSIGPFDSTAEPGVGPTGGRSQGYTVPTVGWYRKHFTVPGFRAGRHVQLRLDGVYQDADFWLNGEHLAFHPNGYTPVVLDVTPHLKADGENVLAVRVDSSGASSRWYAGSGIYRHTWLIDTHALHVPAFGVYVTTPVIDKRSRVVTRVEVTNDGTAPATFRARNTVLDPKGRKVAAHRSKERTVKPGDTAVLTFYHWVDDTQLWSLDSPNLYTARTQVLRNGRSVDTTTTKFGIRSLVWNATDGFLLNGEQIKIRGGCIHHDHGPLGSVSLHRSEVRKIEVLKAAGFNAIRTAHNPHAPGLLDACDRLGMLVWDEFTDMWDSQKGGSNDYSKYFAQYWQQDLTSMLRRDRNHPSVIIWSIGNEIPSDQNGYGPKLAALVRSLDKTRPVTNAAPSFSSDDYIDVIDVHYSTDTSSRHAKNPDKPLTQSESYPSSIYADWKWDQDHPWSAGNWVWAAWDYIGESGCGATPFGPNEGVATAYAYGAVLGAIPYPWFQDFQGDIDLIGQRKPQNHWRAVIYGLSPLEMMVERPPPPGTQQYKAAWGYYDELESWTWDVPTGQAMKVRVYTTGDSVKLLLNGTELATNAVADSDQRITTFSVPYAPGELTAIASKSGSEIGRKTLTTTGAPAALRLTADASSLTTGRDDLAHVLVEVLDSQGRRVPDAVTKVNLAVSGAGELFGVGNGNPHNVDSFSKPRRWTWHGQALAILRPAKTPGMLTLTASADGLQPATATMPVTAPPAPRRKKPARKTALAGFGSGPVVLLALAAGVLRRRIQRTEA